MGVRFTKKDLELFEIPDFIGRMTALKTHIRPKLEALGEEIAPLLMNQFKKEFFVHTAKHLRRKVNPPDETWVALGPQSRGYKAYIYFAFCIGKVGAQARVVMKTESPSRPDLGRNLIANQNFFEKRAKTFSALGNYLKRDADYHAAPIHDLGSFIQESGKRLTQLKSALFDVGLPIRPTVSNLGQQVVEAFDKLYPFYACGLQKKVRLS